MGCNHQHHLDVQAHATWPDAGTLLAGVFGGLSGGPAKRSQITQIAQQVLAQHAATLDMALLLASPGI